MTIIHPTWRAGLKVTGRWSCQGPNMQQLTKDKKDDNDKIIRDGLRTLYVARPGYTFVGADWSQLELRVIALLSGDPVLLDAYAKGEDVHLKGAQMLYEKEKISEAERKLAKTMRFGRFYGGQPPKLYKQMKPVFPALTPQFVEHLCRKIDADHPRIVQWRDEQVDFAYNQGYVETAIYNRRLEFHNGQVEPTKCVNFPVQGTAADLCNLAVLKVDELIDWKETRLLVQCHDELLLEGKDEEFMHNVLVEAMEQTITYKGRTMKFPIDAEKGDMWGRMEPITNG